MKSCRSSTKLSLIFITIFACCIFSCNDANNRISVSQTENKKTQMKLDFHFDTSLNNAEQQLRKESNKLILTSTKETDYFIEPGGGYEKANAPLLLKKN